MHRTFSCMSVLGCLLLAPPPPCKDRTLSSGKEDGILDLQELEQNGQLCWHPGDGRARGCATTLCVCGFPHKLRGRWRMKPRSPSQLEFWMGPLSRATGCVGL